MWCTSNCRMLHQPATRGESLLAAVESRRCGKSLGDLVGLWTATDGTGESATCTRTGEQHTSPGRPCDNRRKTIASALLKCLRDECRGNELRSRGAFDRRQRN